MTTHGETGALIGCFAASPRVGVPGDYVIERAFVESFDGATAGREGGSREAAIAENA